MKVVARGFPKRLAESLHSSDEADVAYLALNTLVDAVNKHDTYTGGHSHRVARYAGDLARLMGSSRNEVDFVQKVALVHDVGKIGIPDAVLQKKGRLTDEEMHLIRLHPILGASILSRMPNMERMVAIVLHHHERWDGLGYPSGLASVDIPIEARTIFVADAFDAMTTQRPYGEVLTTLEALSELRHCSGRQFDPLLVDAMHEAYRNGLLDTVPGSIVLPDSSWSIRL